MRILVGAIIAAMVLVAVAALNPFRQAEVAQAIEGPQDGAAIVEQVEAIFEEVAPLAEAEEVVFCDDLDRPGVIIGRFCRRFEAINVNLRVTTEIPMAALRMLPNLAEIEASGARWDSLAPLLEFENIVTLDLRDAEIADPSALADFDRLESLALGDSNITDLSLIENHDQIRLLDLSGLSISDISALAKMTNLETLYLRGTNVTDLSPLVGFQSLQLIDLRGTGVTDLTPLSSSTEVSVFQ